MALFDNLSDGVRKAFLAGVGAVAIGAEKSQELVDDLVRKGELTVEQGKGLNEELTRKVRETAGSASDEMLRARLRIMTPRSAPHGSRAPRRSPPTSRRRTRHTRSSRTRIPTSRTRSPTPRPRACR